MAVCVGCVLAPAALPQTLYFAPRQRRALLDSPVESGAVGYVEIIEEVPPSLLEIAWLRPRFGEIRPQSVVIGPALAIVPQYESLDVPQTSPLTAMPYPQVHGIRVGAAHASDESVVVPVEFVDPSSVPWEIAVENPHDGIAFLAPRLPAKIPARVPVTDTMPDEFWIPASYSPGHEAVIPGYTPTWVNSPSGCATCGLGRVAPAATRPTSPIASVYRPWYETFAWPVRRVSEALPRPQLGSRLVSVYWTLLGE